ncbi:MAG: type II/IV secretion system protein [Acidimicrobiia bacterium]|nr:type II/IV secretion system protein [Acidimicrobiia bacterium]
MSELDHTVAPPAPARLEPIEASPTVPDEAVGAHIAALLEGAGLLTPEQLKHAKRVHAKLGPTRTLSSILIELGFVYEAALRATLRARQPRLPIGSVLVELGYLKDHDLTVALALQRERPGTRLVEILSEHQFVRRDDVFAVLADLRGFLSIDPDEVDLDLALLRKVPLRHCRTHAFVPLKRDATGVLVVFADPMNRVNVDAARQYLGAELRIGVASRHKVSAAIDRAEKQLAAPSSRVTVADNPIVATVNQVILDAIDQQASDVHLEPMRDRLRIRFRIDGAMLPYKEFPLDLATSIISRIKVMGGADISERRRHQDGRILFEAKRGTVDIRVSVYVSIHGEKVVMRLLNNRGTLQTIKDIGMAPRILEFLQGDALDAPSGVVIITGPTGSGTTTTLYAAVNYLNDANTSIITAEDPVEYVIEGISQCSINPNIHLSYEETLKHIMRQDPDVIVIGEIRDQFSAEVAIHAALTGHKVLTTFHTEDSIGGLVRLMNMNIEAFLISSTVVSIIAQRLLRRVCADCSEDHVLTPHELRRLGYVPTEAGGLTFRRGRGCPSCRHTGYRGRVAVFELLVLNERVRDAVIARKTSFEIRRISTETSGLVTLLEEGIVKAAAGATTFEEIVRELPRLSPPRPLVELQRLLGVKS